MANRFDEFYFKARAWVTTRILRPENFLLFVKYLMLEAARVYPDVGGLEKKGLVKDAVQDILSDSKLQHVILDREKLVIAHAKLLDGWIDTGIKASKQKFHFNAPLKDAGREPTNDVVASIADVAEEWFKDKVVTASNVITGIVAIMQAAGRFFKGDGLVKKDMVMRVVKEIVHRETIQMSHGDRDAIIMAIDTFGEPVVNFLVDLSTGNFDFKGLIEEIKQACLPLSSCCKPKVDRLTDEEVASL